MHNSFETLQKRCRHYRLRRFFYRIIPLLVLVSLLLFGAYLYRNSLTKTAEPSQLKTPSFTVTDNRSISIPKERTKDQHTLEDNRTSLAPAIPNVPPVTTAKDVSYNLHVDADYIPSSVPSAPLSQKKPSTRPSPPAAVTHTLSERASTPTTTSQSAPKRDKAVSMSFKQIDSIVQMKQLYQKEPSYLQALNIAQAYYQTQQYSKSAQWAKKANILARKRDGAWILYAKAEYAKGKQKRAIEILKLYLANARSSEGDALLRTWTQGE